MKTTKAGQFRICLQRHKENLNEQDRNMQIDKQGATALMEKRDGIETKSQLETCSHAVGQGVGLAAASLISYALITHILTRVYSVSREDDLVGGMWVVVATVFVYRESYEKEHESRLITVLSNRSKLRALSDISLDFPVPSHGHGSFDRDWYGGSDSG